jgi:hypothetical protein
MNRTKVRPFEDISPSEKEDPKTNNVPHTITEDAIITLEAKSLVIIASSFFLGAFMN